ncbi:MAG: 6-phosphogluconolactonase, partial [Spirosoma sp.]|nr:6-phosphogluconolactonase [Spirosoma sp.]
MPKILVGLSLLLTHLSLTANAQSAKEILYVGTYSLRGSEGIYVFEFDRKAGTMKPIATVSNTKSPSFLAVHPSKKYIYAVNEDAKAGPSRGGAVSAYAIDGSTGKLTFINEQPSLGSGPCHISIDQTGKTAFVSNYGGGSLAVLPIKADGVLGTATDSVKYTGKGPNTKRQEKAHVHSTMVSPDNRFIYVADLGMDKLNIFEADVKNSTIKPAQTPYVSVKPGSGPRHFTFHPNGKFAYLVEELTSSVAVFSRNAKTGALTLLSDGVKTLPESFSGDNTSADIHIDPSGRFLYQSNRGRNALALFSIDSNGQLTSLGDEPTRGKTPRNFMIDPKGDFIFVAHQ